MLSFVDVVSPTEGTEMINFLFIFSHNHSSLGLRKEFQNVEIWLSWTLSYSRYSKELFSNKLDAGATESEQTYTKTFNSAAMAPTELWILESLLLNGRLLAICLTSLDTVVDGLHPYEPEFPSDTRYHCNIHVTLQEAVYRAYVHGMGSGKLGEDAVKESRNRVLLRGQTWRQELRDQLELHCEL